MAMDGGSVLRDGAGFKGRMWEDFNRALRSEVHSCTGFYKPLFCGAAGPLSLMMGTMKISAFWGLGIALALVSCASPKATPVAETPAVPKKEEKVPEPVVVEEPGLPVLPDDGLRMPDMVTMPEEGEFRSTNPEPKMGTQGGAVISRPPTEPPSRVKAQQD